jgi:type I restriction enzyme R subunit
VADLKGPPPPVHGRFYVFVDECHRTQGGDMNRQMKRWLESAIFIGFTGTPLLRKDKQMTRDVFGTYIHTYKFHQAVADKVVLDLKYEAATCRSGSPRRPKIDEWFEQKTKHLNNFQKASCAALGDDGGADERGRAQAAHHRQHHRGLQPQAAPQQRPRHGDPGGGLDLRRLPLLPAVPEHAASAPTAGSSPPSSRTQRDLARAGPNSDERYKFDTYTQHVLKNGQTTRQYEDEAKRRFIEEPANLKLLIVVSKLLTGFDAPSCTYIYLDNELRDHNLFQAICRTNRLDGDDKDYGHIVDFKELFGDVQQAIAVYSSDELDIDEGNGGDNNVHLKDWLQEGRKQLDEAREALRYLCEPVPQPREVEQYLHYFCGDAADANALNETEPLRVSFYKAVALRACLRRHGPGPERSRLLRRRRGAAPGSGVPRRDPRRHQEALGRGAGHQALRGGHAPPHQYLHPGRAGEGLGQLGDLSLTELIIKTGIHDAIARKLNEKGKLSKNAIAEGIINNVRKTIIREQLTDPRFYEQMSQAAGRPDQAEPGGHVRPTRSSCARPRTLVKRLAAKQPDEGVPAVLHGKPEAVVIYNNLPRIRCRRRVGRRWPSASPNTQANASAWRWRSTASCASALRRAGTATRRARRRC